MHSAWLQVHGCDVLRNVALASDGGFFSGRLRGSSIQVRQHLQGPRVLLISTTMLLHQGHIPAARSSYEWPASASCFGLCPFNDEGMHPSSVNLKLKA